MKNKRRLITYIIALVIVFSCFLYFRYNQKFRIYRNIERLKSGNPDTRKNAVKNLAKIGEPAVEPLLFALQYDSTHIKSGVMGFASSLCKEETVTKINKKLEFESFNLKSGAIEALGEIGDIRALKPLLKIFKNEKKRPFIQYTSNALSKMGKPAITPLAELTRDKSLSVQLWAIYTLGNIPERRSAEALLERFKEQNYNPSFSDNDKISETIKDAIINLDKFAVLPFINYLKNLQANHYEEIYYYQYNTGTNYLEEIIAKIGDKKMIPALLTLMDKNPVLHCKIVFKKCNYSPQHPSGIKGFPSKAFFSDLRMFNPCFLIVEI